MDYHNIFRYLYILFCIFIIHLFSLCSILVLYVFLTLMFYYSFMRSSISKIYKLMFIYCIYFYSCSFLLAFLYITVQFFQFSWHQIYHLLPLMWKTLYIFLDQCNIILIKREMNIKRRQAFNIKWNTYFKKTKKQWVYTTK